MRQHNALGEACCARGVLHVADIVLSDERSHSVDLLNRNLAGPVNCLLPCHTALLFITDSNNISQKRQSLCMELFAALCVLQLGAKLSHDLVIVRISVAFYHNKRMSV